MKDSIVKTLLNYSTSLTKVTIKKLETAKSPEDKIEIISKQFENIKKKVAEVVEKDESIKYEGKSVIKLEFNKLNKRLDIIEATEYANNNFIMGLMKNSTKSVSESDSSDDSNSLFDQLGDLFGFGGDGNSRFDDIVELFTKDTLTSSIARYGLSAIKGVGKFLLNPYVAIPLAAIVSGIIIMNKIKDKLDEVQSKLDTTSKDALGTTLEEVSTVIDTTKDKYGLTKSDYDKLLSDPKLSDKDRNLYESRRSELESTIVDTVSDIIVSDIANKSDIPGNVSTLATDPSKSNPNSKYSMNFTNRVLSSFIIDSRKSTLATNDLANLGDYGMSANEVMHDINQSYLNLSSVNISESDISKTPKYSEFNWVDPISSIKKIAIDYAILKKDTSEPSINKYYSILFKDFISPIELHKNSTYGRTVGQGSRWDSIIKELGESHKDENGRPIYYLPNLGGIEDIYYPTKIKYKDNKEYASRMTISQQYEVLGKTLENESLRNSSNIYTFLPVRITVKYPTYTRDIKIKDSDRISINRSAIIRAIRIENGKFSDTDTIEDLLDNEESLITEYESNLKILSNINSSLDFSQSYDRDSTIISGIKNLGLDVDSDSGKLIMNSLNSWDGIINDTDYDNMISNLSNKTGLSEKKLKGSFSSFSEYKFKSSTHRSDIISSLKNYLGGYDEDFFNKIIEKLSNDSSLIDLYNNKNYKDLASKLGFNNIDINNKVRFDKVKSIIDRIMKYYQLDSYNNEGNYDLDGLIATFLPVGDNVIGDLSNNLNLFGLGTADEIISKGLMTPTELKDFLKATNNSDLRANVKINEKGSLELDYHKSGYTNDSEDIKSALGEVLTQIGLTPDTISNLLGSQSLIIDSQGALLSSGINPTEKRHIDASNDSSVVE